MESAFVGISDEAIELETATLSPIRQMKWIIWLKQVERYKKAPYRYTVLATVVTAASGTILGKYMNVAAELIEEVGYGTEKKTGGTSGIDYSAVRDRAALVESVFDLLFENPLLSAGGPQTSAVGEMNNPLCQPCRWCGYDLHNGGGCTCSSSFRFRIC